MSTNTTSSTLRITRLTSRTQAPVAVLLADASHADQLASILAEAGLDAHALHPDSLADLLKQGPVTLPGERPVVVAAASSSAHIGPREATRRAASLLVKPLLALKTEAVVLLLDPAYETMLNLDGSEAVAAAVEAIGLAWFDVSQYKGAATEADTRKPLAVHLPTDAVKPAKAALAVVDATNHARALCATPPNIANPDYLAKHCKALAKTHGLTCKVIAGDAAKKLNLGGLLAVGAGGSTPPCLIELTYTPAAASHAKKKPVLLVGKAITFDTGGYSLKPKGGPGMKYDKCGGMNVIGTMLALAATKPKTPVVALVAAAENMIDSTAYRPDDIITFHNGVTCEITNTDAEGRLVLADALSYGTKTHKPRAVIDMATLTGGVGVALGPYSAGIWCHDDDLKAALNAAADQTGERLWELPLWPEHRELMKAPHADLHNSAPVRSCHATQGAAFLSFFVGKKAATQMPTTPWAHLDIASVATSSGDGKQPLFGKGPTGFGVRLVTNAIHRLA